MELTDRLSSGDSSRRSISDSFTEINGKDSRGPSFISANEDPTLQMERTQKRRMVYAACAAIVLLVIGIMGGVVLWEVDVITATYVVIQIVTTIGYGDVTARRRYVKYFMSMYILACLVVVAYVLNVAGQVVGRKQKEALRARLKNITREESDPGSTRKMVAQAIRHHYKGVVSATVHFALCVAFGTIFYGTYEACTCSYGSFQIKSCNEDTYQTCVSTGGFVKDWEESFYMSIVTLTTVGFGDHTPRTRLGRAVGAVWMVMGVLYTGKFLEQLSKLFFEIEAPLDVGMEHFVDREVFDEIDRDHNGSLDRAEYLTFVLLKHKLIDKKDLKAVNTEFDRMLAEQNSVLDDSGKLGSEITYATIQRVRSRAESMSMTESSGVA